MRVVASSSKPEQAGVLPHRTSPFAPKPEQAGVLPHRTSLFAPKLEAQRRQVAGMKYHDKTRTM